ncbi:hypothetical protein A6U96_13910 [Agrobacterium tumefaciens]|nr:hypothetical protein A6U96_13910 [Agrobacterium tumefaciens]
MQFYQWLDVIFPNRPIIYELFDVNGYELMLAHLQSQPNMSRDAKQTARLYHCDYLSHYGDVMVWVNPSDEFVLWMSVNGRKIETSYQDMTDPKLLKIWTNLSLRGFV